MTDGVVYSQQLDTGKQPMETERRLIKAEGRHMKFERQQLETERRLMEAEG